MATKERKKSFIAGNPTRIIVLSFAIIILVGAVILTLPVSSKDGHFTNFLDCLFTATSATCVTGLVVFDTFTKWSMFGQIVVLLLIQLGGLGLITLTTFFTVAIGKKLGLKGMQLAQESINSTSIVNINKLVKMIVASTFIFELLGACLLAMSFVPKYGTDGIWMSIFTSISAFCNAGFDLMGRDGEFISLMNYNDSPLVLGTVSLLIIIGGLGFVVWQDLYNYKKTKKLMLHTKIVLIVTSLLIVLGTMMFIFFEWNNPKTMGGLSISEKLLASYFQSVTTRTAGFNSIDITTMYDHTKFFSSVLMFIGAAPGSTGGGIKVTTITVLIMTVISVVKGKSDTVILKRRVSQSVVYKSLSIVVIAMLGVALATGTILLTDAQIHNISGIDALFESVSAFATVGLSSGVTAVSSALSKIILILTMFMGRVGPISLALFITLKSNIGSRNDVIPEGKILVG